MSTRTGPRCGAEAPHPWLEDDVGVQRTGVRLVRSIALLTVVGLALSTVACAPEPIPDWQPQTFTVPGVQLLEGADQGAADDPSPGDAEAPRAPEAATSDPEATRRALDAAATELVGGRLRNDRLPFAARFVYVPGVPDFNARVDELLRSAIAAAGRAYAPQAHAAKAGLAERGCVPGSTRWPAAEVLSRPETGPEGGRGTAVTCEVVGATATFLSVSFRTVTGSEAGVESDVGHELVADVASGESVELGERWIGSAAADLWTRAVALLRQSSGGLSTAPIAEPDRAQRSLAEQALAAARTVDGGVEVSLPPGIDAPELRGLGVAATDRPIGLLVDAETAGGWSSSRQRAIFESAGEPFAGVRAAANSVPIDCELIPCVALTYDDGPSALTSELLDTLADHRSSATFYMLGGAAESDPAVVRRAADEGHELGSHTMTHPDLTTLSAAGVRAEVGRAAAVLRRLSGKRVPTFRPPYGAVDDAVIAAAGKPAVLWSVDTNDWQRPGRKTLVKRAVRGPEPGGIVLFHDTHADTVAVAGEVIEGLRNRGFEPVTVSQLFGGEVPRGLVVSG
ncbi:polysaccharide deacetylase family protein [Leucobacter weissii]|uniref:Polysaccharide deacetylase family protein n=1 Tax=Leucobacter weissii TaxID=1983706 RepID=A0A939S9S3_9MICO|nr:polysaccharide deacetylase family protein [Leucobacter weissii]MBO1901212.1 polysaccharide deacetylase family protein [Leucobacter weissii]